MRIISRIFITSVALLLCGGAMAEDLSLDHWARQSISVSTAKEKIDIADLALALTEFKELGNCQFYFTAFIDKKENPDKAIVLDKTGSYASCQVPGSAYHLEITYWKRNNGHLLAGLNVFWEDEGLENQGEPGDEISSEIYFFNYDPKTHQLTPESGLSKIINDYRRQDYHILLPRQGKNLFLRQFEGAGGATHYLKWNGYDFDKKIHRGK